MTPDITTMGKVIGGGLPVGAYGGRKDIMQVRLSGCLLISGLATARTVSDMSVCSCEERRWSPPLAPCTRPAPSAATPWP